MKRILFLFLIIIGLSLKARCDTINVYWVYYNDSVLAKMNQNMENKEYLIELKKSKVKIGDSISIRYGNDTRSSSIAITIKDSSQTIVEKSTKKGDWMPVSFSVFELLQTANKTKRRDFYFYRDNGNLLFKVRLE